MESSTLFIKCSFHQARQFMTSLTLILALQHSWRRSTPPRSRHSSRNPPPRWLCSRQRTGLSLNWNSALLGPWRVYSLFLKSWQKFFNITWWMGHFTRAVFTASSATGRCLATISPCFPWLVACWGWDIAGAGVCTSMECESLNPTYLLQTELSTWLTTCWSFIQRGSANWGIELTVRVPAAENVVYIYRDKLKYSFAS